MNQEREIEEMKTDFSRKKATGARMERAMRSRTRQNTSWLTPTLRATLVITWYPPLNSCTNANAVCAFHISPPPPPLTDILQSPINYTICYTYIYTYRLQTHQFASCNEQNMEGVHLRNTNMLYVLVLCLYVRVLDPLWSYQIHILLFSTFLRRRLTGMDFYIVIDGVYLYGLRNLINIIHF